MLINNKNRDTEWYSLLDIEWYNEKKQNILNKLEDIPII